VNWNRPAGGMSISRKIMEGGVKLGNGNGVICGSENETRHRRYIIWQRLSLISGERKRRRREKPGRKLCEEGGENIRRSY